MPRSSINTIILENGLYLRTQHLVGSLFTEEPASVNFFAIASAFSLLRSPPDSTFCFSLKSVESQNILQQARSFLHGTC
jgi:hypothetical protein